MIFADRPGGRLERRPAAVVAQCPLDGGPNESTPSAGARDAVDLGYQSIVDLYVHSHVLMLAHSGALVACR